VKSVVSGFAGGEKSTAHYEEVSTGTTGHAESVKITYDPSQITFGEILKVYFSVAHDPTQLNRQGPDHGTQYRSAVFYMNDEQKKIAEAYIQQLDAAYVYSRPIVTQVVPFNGFYAAEAYHQHFLENNLTNPYIVYNDLPKLEALKKQYPQMCKR
ncbi:MAG: peptide-methionine (S)-S-oxide reductase MsrA, partial [Acidobacteriaceae bacterium]|nr:peptide-methionine (S)-S-oxide reductase MsrA [Acidobacteriaceae bacterium]